MSLMMLAENRNVGFGESSCGVAAKKLQSLYSYTLAVFTVNT